jgi:hypothetical protein
MRVEKMKFFTDDTPMLGRLCSVLIKKKVCPCLKILDKTTFSTFRTQSRVVDEISLSRNFAKFREIFISYFAK